jgi:tyrosinase
MVLYEGDTYVITGIKAGVTDTKVPLRLELDTWYPGQTVEHIIQNALFIWALKAFQERDPNRKLSFFQIAGIHGYPYQPWDEEDYTSATYGAGYCTHNSLLFPCWHRPYMALYEQALYEVMITDIIPQVPEAARAQWKSAADSWRLPYWDWAQKKLRKDPSDPGNIKDKIIYDAPLIVKDAKIEVLDYKQAGLGTVAKIDNPMYKFRMPDGSQMGSFGINDVQDKNDDGRFFTVPFSKSRSTSRWAKFEPQGSVVSENWVSGTVDNEAISTALEAHKWYNHNADPVPLAEMVYRLYEPDYIKSYAQFATTRFPKGEDRDPKAYLNLEFIHNNVHNWTGGFDGSMGHMTEVPVAGFDPIFFMHHCNIDRQFAIWQALNEKNPDNWFDHLEKPYDDDGTWNIAPETLVTPQTPLAPFHKNSQGDCFTSDDVKNWMKLGYSYPELQPWLDEYKTDGKFDEAKYTAAIRKQLTALYRPPTSPIVAGLLDDSLKSDIIVNVTYDRFAFNGLPYTIYLFLGDKSTFSNYSGPPHSHPQHVGFVYTFSNPVFGAAAGKGRGCKNCQTASEEGTLSCAQIPITAALVARTKVDGVSMGEEVEAHGVRVLGDMRVESVGAYLGRYLHWSVKTASGTDIEVPEEEPFIEVTVHHRSARFDDRESEAEYVPLEKATKEKKGGYMYKGSSGAALPVR